MSGSNPARKSVDQLLSDFDNLGTGAGGTGTASNAAGNAAHKDAQSLLDDLDSLVQKPRAPAAASAAAPAPALAPAPAASSGPAQAAGTSAAAAAAAAAAVSSSSSAPPKANEPAFSSTQSSALGTGASWGSWGAVWSSAARLADQARAELEKRAPPLTVSGISADGSIQTEKAVPSAQAQAQAQEASANAAHAANAAAAAAQGVLGRGFKFAEGVRGYVKESGWDKIDMIGYDGIETVVFQVLAKVMEQVERNDIEHQLVVNKAPKGGSLPKSHEDNPELQERDLNAVEGFDAAFKLAEAELDALIKARPPPKETVTTAPAAAAAAAAAPSSEAGTSGSGSESAPTVGSGSASLTLPITECPLFIRVQPLFAPLPGFSATGSDQTAKSAPSKHLFFVVVLRDPLHGLRHQVVSQSVPCSWMDVNFETNAWVEQALVDVLHNALSIVGQDYVHGRSVAGSS
ncbi:hypothetical protein OC842_005486 [Tilletia horrida]|uniref:Maintenance of telomere capping protein 1 n=1 Tax=Tilletia horrida TaxID=155126 RepID=A0AAN6G7R8_9BASI|nr:hypothetical protein OC842_005486 [Tilletia horrida]